MDSFNTSIRGHFGAFRLDAFELGVPKGTSSRHCRACPDYISIARGRVEPPEQRPESAMQYTADVGSGGGGQPAEAAVRKGPWTMEEDLVLANYVAANGEGAWNNLARAAGLNRTGKSCRLRWLNYLRPDVRRGNITPEEHILIVELQARWGNRWSKIARHLPGRTDNEIKNFWRTKIQKKQKDGTTESVEAGYQITAPAVAEDQVNSSSGRTAVTPYYVVAAAQQPSDVPSLDHQQGYAAQGGGGGGGGGACGGGGAMDVVPSEFLAASSDNFWAVEDFWPMVPSLYGDC